MSIDKNISLYVSFIIMSADLIQSGKWFYNAADDVSSRRLP